MKVFLVEPYGYCEGVSLALKKALEYKKANLDSPTYCIGHIVHNEDSLAKCNEAGIITLDEKKEDLASQIERIEDGSSIIFCAHGHDERLEEIAKRKNLKILDCTCPFVKENLLAAKKSADEIIYIGVRNHAECASFLANMPNAIFFDVATYSFSSFPDKNKNYSVVTQTTLSQTELDNALKAIKKHVPIKVVRQRCHATIERQSSLRKKVKKGEVTIVLGSPNSNNTLKLKDIVIEANKPAILVRNLQELKDVDLKKYKSATLCSGASTPKEIVEDCYAYLLSL